MAQGWPSAQPSLEAAKDDTSPGIVEAARKTSRLPPKPMEKLATGSHKIDRMGLKIAALLAVDPVVDHSVSATLARRREQRARHDAFRSIATSQRAGRSPPARNHSIDGARKQGSADYAYGQPAN